MFAIVVAFGSHGDVLPLVAIADELRRRGARVLFVSFEPFRTAAARAGLEFEAFASAEEFDVATGHPDLWKPIAGVRRLFSYAGAKTEATLEIIRRRRIKGETIIVASSLALGARLARDVVRTPLATVHLAPLLLDSSHDMPRLPSLPPLGVLPQGVKRRIQLGVDERVIGPVVLPGLNALRSELGLGPVRRVRHWWNAPQLVLLMCPAWFAPPQPDWPSQLTQCGFPNADAYGGATAGLDPATAAFLSREDKVVVVTFGSDMRQGQRLYRAAIRAALALGRRALVLAPIPLDLPEGCEGRVHVARYAPLRRVMPHAAAVMHHGGVGTLAIAFAAGAPQVVVPIAFDNFDNAARVRRLGCGWVIDRRLFWSGTATMALRAAIASPSIAAACRRVARMATPDGVMTACDAIEALFAASIAKRRDRPAAGSEA